MQQEMEYIYEVYKEKNFTRAAEKLFITQPALSMAIQKVEERLGMPIFDRSTRPISLTDAGYAYLDYIESARHLDAEFEQQIRDIKELDKGRVVVGGSHYLNAYILPQILAGFLKKYPNVEIEIKEASSAELAERLRRQELDVTFHCSPEFIQDFPGYPAFRDMVLLAVPVGMDPLAGKHVSLSGEQVTADPLVGQPLSLSGEQVMAGWHLQDDCPCVSLSEFREIPFILLSRGNNLYERSVRMFEEAGFAPKTKMKLSQLVTAYHLAAAGIGATFVSDLLIRDSDQELNYYKIDSNLVTRQFYALLPKRKYVSVAARRFIEHFQESSFGAELYK